MPHLSPEYTIAPEDRELGIESPDQRRFEVSAALAQEVVQPHLLFEEIAEQRQRVAQLTTEIEAARLDPARSDAVALLTQDLAQQQEILRQNQASLHHMIETVKNSAGGNIEHLPMHLRDQYKISNGEWEIVPLNTPEKRREYNILKKMLSESLRQKASNRAKNRSMPDIIRELEGNGNDVEDRSLVDAVFTGNIRYITDHQIQFGVRATEKAASFVFAALEVAKQWESGTEMREYLINRIPIEALERVAVELALSQSFGNARGGDVVRVHQQVVALVKGMDSGHFASDASGQTIGRESVAETMRQGLIHLNTDRVISRQFITSLEKIVGPIEKV